jgi:hypothetical protein
MTSHLSQLRFRTLFILTGLAMVLFSAIAAADPPSRGWAEVFGEGAAYTIETPRAWRFHGTRPFEEPGKPIDDADRRELGRTKAVPPPKEGSTPSQDKGDKDDKDKGKGKSQQGRADPDSGK